MRYLKIVNSELIISSPYTRALQTAAIISKNLNLEINVEFNLIEWQPDLNLEITNRSQLNNVIDDYENLNGIHPPEIDKTWESKKMMKYRVDQVLEKYSSYENVIGSYARTSN